MQRSHLAAGLLLLSAVPATAAATPGEVRAPAPSTRSAAAGPAAAAEPGWRRLELPDVGSHAWRYLPARPSGGTEGHPVVVFLHGSGASPEIWRPFLAAPAEASGAVVVAPAPADPFGWGIADDSATVAEALERLGAELPIDRSRIALAGHSAGGAYAYFLAYETGAGFAAVFSFSAPFRYILGVADPEYTAPLRLWYGAEDPNFFGGHANAIAAMAEHRGIPWEVEVVPGLGHNDIRQEDLTAGFAFLVEQTRPRANRLLPKARTRARVSHE